jgi:DNA-binding NarL/FixJ family response regulator
MIPAMERVPGDCEDDGRPVGPQLPRVRFTRRTPVESNRLNGGWLRDLTVLDGGVLRRLRPAQAAPAISVLVAEPMGLVRAGIRSLLERENDITVVGEALCGDQAVTLATEMRPNVVLMDIELTGPGALGATRRILADPNLSQVRVVILTADEREEDLFEALRSGASGFMLLDTEPVELLHAVRVVAGGGAQVSPWATRRLLEEFASMPDPASSHLEQFDELTARERDIVQLVALGLSNGEIAQRLVISPATVKTHVSRAIVKLHARDRAKLVALAHQTGFVMHHRAADAARGRRTLKLAAGDGA